MTTPDDRLGVLLRSAADDVLERDVPRGPDPGSMWGRGRRTTWAARAVAGGLAVLLVLVLGSLVAVLRPAAVSVPAGEGAGTYPEYVSDLMPGYYQAGDGPVFGV